MKTQTGKKQEPIGYLDYAAVAIDQPRGWGELALNAVGRRVIIALAIGGGGIALKHLNGLSRNALEDDKRRRVAEGLREYGDSYLKGNFDHRGNLEETFEILNVFKSDN